MAYEKTKRDKDLTPSTIMSYIRHLRSVINYFTHVVKIIPKDYNYPFGKGGYIIRKIKGCNIVMDNKEIKSVVNFKNFESKEQEYARDIWLLLYRANGMNYADLYRMKWSNIKGYGKKKYLIFIRTKTETTSSIIRSIVAPITPKVQVLLDRVGDKNSPYILGLCQDDFDEETIENKKEWQKQKLNKELKKIGEKLSLSVDLRLKSARYCYGNTFKRVGINYDQIGEMYGHADVATTEFYISQMDLEKTWNINRHVL